MDAASRQVFFRRPFYFKGKPLSGYISLTANKHFWLYLNGIYLARDDTLRKDAEEVKRYDIGKLLKPGIILSLLLPIILTA